MLNVTSDVSKFLSSFQQFFSRRCTTDYDCPYRYYCAHWSVCISEDPPSIDHNSGTLLSLAVQTFILFVSLAFCLCLPCLCVICGYWLGCCVNGDQEAVNPSVTRRRVQLLPESSVKIHLGDEAGMQVHSQKAIIPVQRQVKSSKAISTQAVKTEKSRKLQVVKKQPTTKQLKSSSTKV